MEEILMPGDFVVNGHYSDGIDYSNIEINLDRAKFDPTNIKLILFEKEKRTTFTLNLNRLVAAGLLDVTVEDLK